MALPDDLIALINSKPQSPTRAEIESLLVGKSSADKFFGTCPVSMCCGRHRWRMMPHANVPSWGCECGAVTACDPTGCQ